MTLMDQHILVRGMHKVLIVQHMATVMQLSEKLQTRLVVYAVVVWFLLAQTIQWVGMTLMGRLILVLGMHKGLIVPRMEMVMQILVKLPIKLVVCVVAVLLTLECLYRVVVTKRKLDRTRSRIMAMATPRDLNKLRALKWIAVSRAIHKSSQAFSSIRNCV